MTVTYQHDETITDMLFYKENEVFVCSADSLFAVNINHEKGKLTLSKGMVIHKSRVRCIQRITDKLFIFAD